MNTGTNHILKYISKLFLLGLVGLTTFMVSAQNQSTINTGKFILSTNGFGTGYSHYYKENSRAIFVDLQTLRHPQETNVQNTSIVNPRSYVFAKVNSLASLRLGYSAYKILSNGSNESLSPQIALGVSVGPNLGIIKPYYVSYQHGRRDGTNIDIIQQNEETIQNSDSVYGPVSWTKGFNNLNFTPGIHTDIHLTINWNHSYYFQSCKIGVRFDYFINDPQILYNSKNQMFTAAYISYEIGR